MNDQSAASVHWSFWAIGAVTLIWNAMGGANYVMQMSPEALANYPEAARTLVENRPAWATGAFAIAVFGGALGCLLLLLRKQVAVYLFVASLLGVIATNVHSFGASDSTEIRIGGLMSLAVAAFLNWYSKWAGNKGWIS